MSITLVLLSACSNGPVIDEQVEQPVEVLYNEALDLALANQPKKAAPKFEEVERQHPYSVWAVRSQIMAGWAFYAENDYQRAVATLDRFIELYPADPLTEYAYYLRALANFDKGQNFLTKIFAQDPSKYDVSKLRASFDDFSIVINKFPKSKYAKDSRNRLLYIKNMMAKNELYIAKYYVKRQAYIAAIERVKYLLTNYNGTPSTEEALLILIEGYNYLGMNEKQTFSSWTLMTTVLALIGFSTACLISVLF